MKYVITWVLYTKCSCMLVAEFQSVENPSVHFHKSLNSKVAVGDTLELKENVYYLRGKVIEKCEN